MKLLTLLLLSCFSFAIYAQWEKHESTNILTLAEMNASDNGKIVLNTAKTILDKKEIIQGGCWDFINEVYNRAGYPLLKRTTVYDGKLDGPFVSIDQIEAGDWLYHINHSYKGSEHSGIFVTWKNFEKREALMISYQGENKKRPPRLKTYNLSNVYKIIRPQ